MKRIFSIPTFLYAALLVLIMTLASCGNKTVNKLEDRFSPIFSTLRMEQVDSILNSQPYNNEEDADSRNEVRIYLCQQLAHVADSKTWDNNLSRFEDIIYSLKTRYGHDSTSNVSLKNFLIRNQRIILFDTLDNDKKEHLLHDLLETGSLDTLFRKKISQQIENYYRESWAIQVTMFNNAKNVAGLPSCYYMNDIVTNCNDSLILKQWLGMVEHANNMYAKECFTTSNDLDTLIARSWYGRSIRSTISQKHDSIMQQRILKKIQSINSNPTGYTYKFLREHYLGEYYTAIIGSDQYQAEMVKKAKSYEECKDLLNVLRGNSPVWRACDAKAQRFLGFETCR